MNESKLTKFIVFYQIPPAVIDEWAKTEASARKEAEEKMKSEWQKWMNEHAKMIKVTEACGKTKQATAQGISDIRNEICLYSIIEAESHDIAVKAFEHHPHLQIPQASIQVMAVRSM